MFFPTVFVKEVDLVLVVVADLRVVVIVLAVVVEGSTSRFCTRSVTILVKP